MSPSLFLTLICCAGPAEQPHAMRAHREVTVRQLEALHVAIEAAPTELYVGDVVFVTISVTNKGDEPLSLPAQSFPNWSLDLDDLKHNTSFTIPHGGGCGEIGPERVLPGERLGYLSGSRFLVNVPPLQCLEFPFWNAERLSKDGYSLSFTLWIGRRGHVGARGPTLTIRPRPKAEIAKLLGVFRYEIAVEVALSAPLLEGDLETRRAWLKRRLKSPLAAPYLKDFEERLKAVEKRLEQRGKQPKKRESPQRGDKLSGVKGTLATSVER